MMKTLCGLWLVLLSAWVWGADRAEQGGEVRVPLPVYTQLLEQTRREQRPAPAAYAIGDSQVRVTVTDEEDRSTAQVEVTVLIETFEAQWTLVPLLPSGVALSQATVDGQPVPLVQGPEGLSWSTDQAARVTLQLNYGVVARRSARGFVLPVPVPRAAATRLQFVFPGTGLDLAVVPSADQHTREQEGRTHVMASVPATSSILISWRAPSKRSHVLSRAHYWGKLEGEAVLWKAEFEVEALTGELITLPLLPSQVTLNDLRVDGQQATVLEEDGRFVSVLQGRGMHKVQVLFQTSVLEQQGPPQTQLQVPRVPVSRFDLVLPGSKEVTVNPQANVVTTERDAHTEATVFMPMGDSLTFSWVDAIPQEVRTRVRANASLYHGMHAEEGVLHGHAVVAYEITHGETNSLELEIPTGIQVNRITAPSGGVSDWVVAAAEQEGYQRIQVFLDRAVKGEYGLEVFYERLLGAGAAEPVPVPLLRAVAVHRQRGMVALLAGPELTLKPLQEERLSSVGENQLPAFVRNRLALTVAHTYKYTDPDPMLVVKAVAPERQQGKFDAQVDTLISIGEVTMRGSATVEVNVKSGSIMELSLKLPDEINVLGVSGPSLRTQQVRPDENGQSIQLEFTREMEGQFRIEVNYERIMGEGEAQVPTITVFAAEVEHGRIAVEALSAVEVQAAAAERLSTLDINELPQQLVLKTTNPILLAYKYVHAQPPFGLALKITRHPEIQVQEAAIEEVVYRTLFTSDGLAVTSARFVVRNSRRQFLRLDMPSGSRIWSVFVDDRAEKPARVGDAENTSAVLIKMINSAAGFPVDMVYATPVAELGFIGTLSARLPQPDMVVTRTRWDVFLPAGPKYGTPDSRLDLVQRGYQAEAVRDVLSVQPGQALRINVPTRGIHYAFEKLYANQSLQPAGFSIRYVSVQGSRLGLLLSILGTLLVWAAILALARFKLSRHMVMVVLGLGAVLLLVSVAYLKTSPVPASVLSLLVALLLGMWFGLQRWRVWRQGRAADL